MEGMYGILLLLPLSFGQPLLKDTDERLKLTLSAIEKGLNYMQKHYRDINLDAVIGTRMVEGQLDVLLHRFDQNAGPTLSEDVELKLEEIKQKASYVSDAAMPFVMSSQPEYYARIGAIIQPNFWTQDHPSQDLNPQQTTNIIVNGEAMREKDSDDCLTELFGTSGKSSETCQVSRFCWKLMTSKGYGGYSLSHQLFYLQIANSFGCLHADVEDIVSELSQGFCANMMIQARNIAQQGYPNRKQDLFMEIQALCGISGFRQFFNDEWLTRILNWQWKPQGCWGEEQNIKGHIKREERVLSDGCESHRTAVALSALVQYVRYIVEFMQKIPSNQF